MAVVTEASDTRPDFPRSWKPPTRAILKLNFDGGKIGEQGWGRGFAVRSFDDDGCNDLVTATFDFLLIRGLNDADL